MPQSTANEQRNVYLESTGGVRLDGTRHDNYGIIPRAEHIYNRGIDAYSNRINKEGGPHFSIENYRGKTLLDIGSGAYERFAQEAKEYGVTTFNVNPSLSEESHREMLLRNNRLATPEKSRRKRLRQSFMRGIGRAMRDVAPGDLTVAALGQQLPFKDESFDCITSIYGVPYYLYADWYEQDQEDTDTYTDEQRSETITNVSSAFNEIIRTLKPGGEAFLVDLHREVGHVGDSASYTYSDGSEIIEVLDSLEGIEYEVVEEPVLGGPFNAPGIERTIRIHKLETN